MASKSLAAPMPSTPSMSKSDADYRAEDDHRTLMRAEEIRQDPTRVKGVARHHAKMTTDIARVGRSLGRKARRGR